MSVNTAPLQDPAIFIKPSQKLLDYIDTVDVSEGLPLGISNVVFKNPVKNSTAADIKIDYLLTPEDKEFLRSVGSSSNNVFTKLPINSTSLNYAGKLLSLKDLHWLYQYINKYNKDNLKKVYLHELIEGCEIVLPKNPQIPRNPELENRCKKLRAQHENKVYNSMTKNVDNVRKKYPEDTLAFQSK